MKVTFKNSIKKHQVGGQIEPVESPVLDQTAPQGGEDPIMILALMATQALQTLDCLLGLLVCLAFLEMVKQMLGGVPEEPLGEPVFKKGGILVRRIKK